MTFVGKILVIVIMAFSLLFLAMSTVVFVTSKNWMVETKKERLKSDDLKKKLNDANAAAEAAKKDAADYKAACDQDKKTLDNRLAAQQDEINRSQAEITSVKGHLAVAQQTAKSTMDEVESKRQQTLQLRQQLSAVEKQANEYKLEQAEKNDKIRDLERKLDTAVKRNVDLRDQVARYTTLLTSHGLSTDISQIKGLENPPPVVGEVKRIDATNREMEITIGSDDGLVVGHELYLFRVSPRPEYLGKIAIVQVDPDQAVAKVVGKTYMGKKIKEGDIVSSTIKPRF